MQLKNLPTFILLKILCMPAKFLKRSFAILFTGCLLMAFSFCSCKKIALLTGGQSALEQYFADNVLNRDFVVDFASDTTTDITSKYTGYTFVLAKDTSFYSGPMTATRNNITYSGTWQSNNDYSKLIINLTKPSIPDEFVFLNRMWKFTKKDPPILKLAPWVITSPKVLYMRRL